MKRNIPADMRDIYALRAETIDYFFPDREEEIDFWAEQAKEYGNDILHLMCGTGELSAGLAQRGFDVTGIDFTDSMVYIAKNRFEDNGLDNSKIVKADARYFNLNKKFDFAFISTGDFHHFIEEEEIDSILSRIYAHLKPGGALALELYPLPEEDFHRPEKNFKPLRETPEGMKVWKVNQTSYHPDTQILEIIEELHVEENGDMTNAEYEIQLKLFSEEEMDDKLRENGFENIEHYGGYDFSPYLERSKTWIVVAEI